MGKEYIDLTKPQHITLKLGEDIIDIPELSYGEYDRIAEYNRNLENVTREEEADMMLWLLNRNTSGKQFTREDLNALPSSNVQIIYRACVMMMQNILNDPNS